MIEDECNHKWRQFKNASKDIPAKYECKNCKSWLTASDVYQLETLKHIRGFEKWLSLFAFIISVIALVVAIMK